MNIVRLDYEHVRVPLSVPYEIAFEAKDRVDIVYITITTSNGLTGFGSAASCQYVTGESVEDTKRALGLLSDRLKGFSALEIPSVDRIMKQICPAAPAAMAGVDMALYDLLGKHLKLPVVNLLGPVHESLPTSVTIGICSVEETMEKAESYVSQGFRTLKVKLGNDLQNDIERVVRLREGFHKALGIRVDPNQGYSCQELIEFQKAIHHLNIEFIEQPCKPKLDIELAERLALVREKIDASQLPLAADESLLNSESALNFLRTCDIYDIFNIKLMKCGGITGARSIVNLAEISKKSLMWGCNDESVVSISAALHSALATPATRYLDLDGHFDLTSDRFCGGVFLQEGKLTLSDKPGLGVALLD